MCFVYNAIFVKLFSTFDKLIIEQCQYLTGVLPFQYRLDQIRINFLFSLSDSLASPQMFYSCYLVIMSWKSYVINIKLRLIRPMQAAHTEFGRHLETISN